MNILTIGSGSIVTTFYQALSSCKHSKIVATYSRSLETAMKLKESFQAKSAYDNYNLALLDETVDTVYIGSVNSAHYQQALLAIRHHKHVIMEKPVTPSPSQYAHLVQQANLHDVYIIEGVTTMYLPNYRWILENLSSLGEIRSVSAFFHTYSAKYQAYLDKKNPNVFTLEHGGGALVDLNLYNLHFVIKAFGLPKHATYNPLLGYNGIDISGVALLTYDSFIAICSGAKNVNGDTFVTIEGELGTIKVIGGAARCYEVEATINGEKQRINYQPSKNLLSYECAVFEQWFDQKETHLIQQANQHTLAVLTLASTIRKKAHIHYPEEIEALLP